MPNDVFLSSIRYSMINAIMRLSPPALVETCHGHLHPENCKTSSYPPDIIVSLLSKGTEKILRECLEDFTEKQQSVLYGYQLRRVVENIANMKLLRNTATTILQSAGVRSSQT